MNLNGECCNGDAMKRIQFSRVNGLSGRDVVATVAFLCNNTIQVTFHTPSFDETNSPGVTSPLEPVSSFVQEDE